VKRSSTRYGIAGLVAALSLGAILSPPAVARPPRPVQRLPLSALRPAAVPGELIVEYERSLSGHQRRAVLATAGARLAARTGPRSALVRLGDGATQNEVMARLEAQPGVANVESNLVRYLSEVPNDPSFASQWGLHNVGQAHPMSGSSRTKVGTLGADIKITSAWDTTQGSEDTVIAILDSGVDITHPDLAANLWVNPGEIAANGRDDDGNGYIDDVNGWDFAQNDNTLLETSRPYFGFDHGTHVAGTAAAVANNELGIAGVCPRCKIMVLKIFEPGDSDGDGVKDSMLGDIAAELKAIDYAIDMGADVVNGSFGAPLSWSRAERRAVARAIRAGITPVFAAGNETGDNDLIVLSDLDGDRVPDSMSPSYPASYNLEGLISVAASNDLDRNAYSSLCEFMSNTTAWPCSFTNWGHDSVDLSAPGVDVTSTVPGGYATFDGTSMAAPHVSGIAGLILSIHPTFTPNQVKNALLNSVDHPAELATLTYLPDRRATGQFTVTGGRANAASALTAASTDQFPVTDGNIPGARRIRSLRFGAVTWPEDSNDVYFKTLKRGARYKVVLNGPSGSDLDLAIYEPGIKEIWQLEEGCLGAAGPCKVVHYNPQADADESRRFTAKKAGTYYFHVSAYLFQEGGYSLRVRKL
jgi:subtilisin family serine protease